MANQSVCSWYTYGYCRHREGCRKRHVKENCEERTCDIYSCIKRHPKNCKFYWNYERCKFNPCAFLHKNNNENVESIKEENKRIALKLLAIDKELKELEIKAKVSEFIIDKLAQVENKFEHLTIIEKKMNDKDLIIDNLVAKVNELEKRITCSYCDFQALSEQGLKVHMKRKHTLTGSETYPRNCEICDIQIESRSR